VSGGSRSGARGTSRLVGLPSVKRASKELVASFERRSGPVIAGHLAFENRKPVLGTVKGKTSCSPDVPRRAGQEPRLGSHHLVRLLDPIAPDLDCPNRGSKPDDQLFEAADVIARLTGHEWADRRHPLSRFIAGWQVPPAFPPVVW
jgi:hypothetical protein